MDATQAEKQENQAAQTSAPAAGQTAPGDASVIQDALAVFSKAGFDYEERDTSRFIENPSELIRQLSGWVAKQGRSSATREVDDMYKKRRSEIGGFAKKEGIAEVPEPRSYTGLLGS